VGRLGDEAPADELFEIPRHRPPSISRRILLELPIASACGDMVLYAMTRSDIGRAFPADA
jgi:hypothetical protein